MSNKTLNESFDIYISTMEILENTEKYKKPLNYDDLLIHTNELLSNTVDNNMSILKETLNLDNTGFDEFIENYNNRQKEDVCDHFTANEESFNNVTNGRTLIDLVKIFTCNSCNNLYQNHTSCNNFIAQNASVNMQKKLCKTCGMLDKTHICNNFSYCLDDTNKLKQVCGNCNMIHLLHIKDDYCETFADNTFGYCTSCDRHISNHLNTELYHNLNNETKSLVYHNAMALAIESFDKPFCRNLCDDLNKKIFVPNYVELLKLQNDNNYHNILKKN